MNIYFYMSLASTGLAKTLGKAESDADGISRKNVKQM
jgi:hypothetical protein